MLQLYLAQRLPRAWIVCCDSEDIQHWEIGICFWGLFLHKPFTALCCSAEWTCGNTLFITVLHFLFPLMAPHFCITTEITRSTEIRITSHQLYIQYTSYGGIKYSTDQNMIRNFLLAFYVTEWAAFDWSSKQSDTLANWWFDLRKITRFTFEIKLLLCNLISSM